MSNDEGGGSDEQSSRAKIIDGPGKGKNMTDHLGVTNDDETDWEKWLREEEEEDEMEEEIERELMGNLEHQNCQNEDDCPCPKCSAARAVEGPVAAANFGATVGAIGNEITTNPASWVEDEDVWEKAKEAASKSYDEAEDAYYPVVTTIYKKMGGGIKGNAKVAFTMNVTQQKSGQADDPKAPAKLVGEPNPPGFDGRGLATLETDLEGIAGEGDFTRRFPEKNKSDGLIPELHFDADDHQGPKHGPAELAAEAARKRHIDKGKLSDNVWTDEAREAAREAQQRSAGANASSAQTPGQTGAKQSSGDAAALSKRADSPEEHEKAAGAHQAAAQQHAEKARGGAGATPQSMQAHAQAAKAHQAAADAHDRAASLKHAALAHNQGPDDHLQMPPHDASKSAASASVRAEHGPSRQMALTALDHSHDNNPSQAAKYHEKAADQHQEAATDLRSQGGSEEQASRHDEAGALHRKAASLHSATMNWRQPMGLSTREREGLIGLLAVNCNVQPSTLNRLGDEKLIGLRRALQKFVTNTFAEGSNAGASGSGSTQAGGAGTKSEHQTAGEDVSKVRNEDDDEEKKKSTQNMSMDEYEQTLPPEGRAMWQQIRNMMNRDKGARVARIVANVRDPERKRVLTDKYMAKTLNELKDIEELVAPVRNTFVIDRELASYLGAGGGPVDNASGYMSKEEEEDILPLPTINWQEESARKKQDAV